MEGKWLQNETDTCYDITGAQDLVCSRRCQPQRSKYFCLCQQIFLPGQVRGHGAAAVLGDHLVAGRARHALPGGSALQLLRDLDRVRPLHGRHREDHLQHQEDHPRQRRGRRAGGDRGARLERHRGQPHPHGPG